MKAYAHYYIAAGAMIALSSGILAILSGAVMAGSFMVTGGLCLVASAAMYSIKDSEDQ